MLETIWFVLWALLWAVYFVLDGFDLGVGTLLPFLGRKESERKAMYAAAGPFWDGNEVWLISAGGVTFAAFPNAYAVLFSALYAPLLMLLFALIFRAVSFEFRDKVEHPAWRGLWDGVHFLANLVPCILLGVAFANLFMGIPVDVQGVYHGSLPELLNVYGLAGGVFFCFMFVHHGAIWLAAKTRGDLQVKALGAATFCWPIVLVLLVAFLGLTASHTDLYDNYKASPTLLALPAIALLGLVGARTALRAGKLWTAFAWDAVFIIGVTFFGVMGMFPRLIISSLDPIASVTILNGASTPLTLKIMLGVAAVMVPIVLIYQGWVYRLFSDAVDGEEKSGAAHY
ncbi:MAG: cytochrome d ubiquinol oxidase subunit II [Desulfovibrio sp.]|nr:cytochrome d ubiquinol oxidase subunit II [Desulfovibrio sp.]